MKMEIFKLDIMGDFEILNTEFIGSEDELNKNKKTIEQNINSIEKAIEQIKNKLERNNPHLLEEICQIKYAWKKITEDWKKWRAKLSFEAK